MDADRELHHHHPVVRRIYVYIFIVVFLLFFVILAVYFSTTKPFQPGDEVVTEEVEELPVLETEPKGTFTLGVRNNETAEVSAGQTFFLTVNASSEGSEIVGFDVLLDYDRDAFTQGNATTPLQAFQVSTSSSEDHESFTAYLSTSGTPVAFEETEVLVIPFTANQKGKYTFSVLPLVGTETTKMVESETTALFAPDVTSLQVTVN